ncbi:MAG: undecaprenyl-diphosphate phosphatase [Pseudomonadota bacterium]
MPFYHILILALIQGISEFLPISSSGHLVLSHHLLGNGGHDLCWQQNRMLDVAVHFGTLLSVLLYFRKDLLKMAIGCGRFDKKQGSLVLYIVIASIPVVIAGFILQMLQPSLLCMIEVMAWMTLIFGGLLYFADRSPTSKTLDQMTISNSLFIGLSQALALIPGVSRSGITMTTARFFGYSRTEAAKFSLLLSIIAISGAGFLSGLDLFQSGDLSFGIDILTAIALSFIAGYIAIALMMKWLSKATFIPFVIYRVLLGVLLLGLIYSGVL